MKKIVLCTRLLFMYCTYYYNSTYSEFWEIGLLNMISKRSITENAENNCNMIITNIK